MCHWAARTAVISVLLLCCSPVTTTAGEPPDFQATRWSEDYRYLNDPAKRVSLLDDLKYVPLSSNADHFLSFGGQYRLKPVYFDAPLFGLRDSEEDRYVLQRLMLHVDWHAGELLRTFVELSDARAWSKNRPLAGSDASRADLQLAFADLTFAVFGGGMTLRLGRQELSFDSVQRFVSLREGPNVRQAFDGARIIWSQGLWSLTAFATAAVDTQDGKVFDDRSEGGADFDGLRISHANNVGVPGSIDVYYYRYQRDGARFRGVVGDEQRDVGGMRVSGQRNGYDWDVEAVYQGGRFRNESVRAWALGSTASYLWAEQSFRPRVGIQFDVASGDDDPLDGMLQTFNPLFPKGAYFSEAGLTGFSNLINLSSSFSFAPVRRASVRLAAGQAWRESSGDALYGQPLIAVPLPGVSTSRSIGNYLQTVGSYQVNRHLTLGAEWQRYFVSSALRAQDAKNTNYLNVSFNLLF